MRLTSSHQSSLLGRGTGVGRYILALTKTLVCETLTLAHRRLHGGTMEKKTCFVVQGFGKKTDHKTGRVLDLDASYEVIKEAVENADLTCIRADEIQHSGVIDKPMFQQLLEADLVIADLSTSNFNAAYDI